MDKQSYHAHISFYFANHVKASNLVGIFPLFRKCDVYIPEAFMWGNETARIFRNVSAGIISPAQALHVLYLLHGNSPRFYNHRLAEFNLVYGTNKPVLFVDIPYEHELALPVSKSFRRLMKLAKRQSRKKEATINESIKAFGKAIKTFGHYQRLREEYMLQQIKRLPSLAVETYAHLENLSQPDILIRLGTVHTYMEHNLRKGGFDVSRRFESFPYYYDPRPSLIRNAMFGKPHHEYLTRSAWTSNILQAHKINLGNEQFNPKGYGNKIFQRLMSIPYEHMEKLYNRADSVKEFAQQLGTILKRRPD